MSFPIYLLNIPVLCSVGCGLLLAGNGAGMGAWAAWVAAPLTIIATFVLALPLRAFDQRWIAFIGRSAKKFPASPAKWAANMVDKVLMGKTALPRWILLRQ